MLSKNVIKFKQPITPNEYCSPRSRNSLVARAEHGLLPAVAPIYVPGEVLAQQSG